MKEKDMKYTVEVNNKQQCYYRKNYFNIDPNKKKVYDLLPILLLIPPLAKPYNKTIFLVISNNHLQKQLQ
jgi:hypothetical protein